MKLLFYLQVFIQCFAGSVPIKEIFHYARRSFNSWRPKNNIPYPIIMKVYCKRHIGFELGGFRNKIYKVCTDKPYDIVRQDNISYYLLDDTNSLTEIPKDFFEELNVIRDRKLNELI